MVKALLGCMVSPRTDWDLHETLSLQEGRVGEGKKGKRERGKRERGRRGDRRGGGIKKRQTGGRGSDKSTDKLKTHTLSS